MAEPIKELREHIIEILGEPNEGVVDALLVFATNEVARIAGCEMTARWQAEDALKAMEQRMRKTLDNAEWGGPDRANCSAPECRVPKTTPDALTEETKTDE